MNAVLSLSTVEMCDSDKVWNRIIIESENKKNFEKYEKLTYGFIRNIQLEIPLDICKCILCFCPTLPTFVLFDDDYFEISPNGLIIRGKEQTCKALLIYISSWTLNGYTEGIHYLSIMNHNEYNSCYHSIGIKDEINEEWIHEEIYNDFHTDYHNTNASYLSNTASNWNGLTIVTIKLNCNNWTVEYYQNGKYIQQDTIKPNKSYHFAISICGSKDSIYEIVDNPTIMDQEINEKEIWM
eukprot:542760_1